MTEEHSLDKFVLRLSTGYEVEVDTAKPSKSWLDHIANAVIGERFLQDSKAAGEWRLDVIPEELRYLLVTVPPPLKDALLYAVMFDAVSSVYRRLDRRARGRK